MFRRSRTSRRPSGARPGMGSVLALGIGTGLALVAPLPARLPLPGPREPALVMAESLSSVDAASAAARVYAGGLDTLAVLVTLALFLAGSTLLLAGLSRRSGVELPLAVRGALGAGPGALVRHLWHTHRGRWGLAGIAGMASGLAARALALWSWPAPGAGPETVFGSGSSAARAGATSVPSSWVLLAALSAIAAVALLLPLPGLDARTPGLLRRGHGVTDDPRAGTFRRGAVALQVGVAFALAAGGLSLAHDGGAGPQGEVTGLPDRSIQHLQVRETDAVSSLLAAHPGVVLASRGAFLGLGRREQLLVECGACYVGIDYVPFQGVDTMLHAVSPGFFEAVGLELIEGRGFTPDDGPGAEEVALVSARFAAARFEDGEPVGHRIRLPGVGERWVRIVGVVSDRVTGVPGSHDAGSMVLYLPVAQHRVRALSVTVSPDLTANASAAALELPDGIVAAGPTLDLHALRRATLAPVRWTGVAVALVGSVALLLSLVGVVEVAGVEARGRTRAAAIRVALGGPAARVARMLLRRALATTLGSLAFGWVGARAVREAAGGTGSPAPEVALPCALLLVLGTWVGTRPATARLAATDPGPLLSAED